MRAPVHQGGGSLAALGARAHADRTARAGPGRFRRQRECDATDLAGAPRPPARLQLGRLAVDRLTFSGALDAIEGMVERRRGGVVFTPNVDHVVIAERDAEFREAYAHADLCLADGMPIVWCSRLLGAPLPEKISGSDLVLPLMSRAAARSWTVFLLGAGPGVADCAAERLRRERGTAVVGTAAPRVSGGARDPDHEGDAAV